MFLHCHVQDLFSPQKLIFPQAMELFILDEHELKHNLSLQREAQKSYNMTPRGIQNTLQCNPHFSSAFSTEFPTVLLTASSYCFAYAVDACSRRHLGKKKKRTSAGNGEGREKLKQIKCRLFLSTGAK